MKRAKQQDMEPEPTPQRKYPWLKKDVHSWDKKEMAFARSDVSEMFDSPIFELAFYGFVSRVEELAVEAAAGGALMITEAKPFDARRLAQAIGMAATTDEVVKFLGICEAWDILSKSGDTYTLNYYGKIVGKVDTTAADRQRRFRERERERLKAEASEGEANVTVEDGVMSMEVVMSELGDASAAEPVPEARETQTGKGTKLSDGFLDDLFQRGFWPAYPRKVGKDEALSKFRTKVRENAKDEAEAESLVKMMALAIKASMHTMWAGNDKRYIPYPATWLSAGRWNDEFDMPEQPQSHSYPASTGLAL